MHLCYLALTKVLTLLLSATWMLSALYLELKMSYRSYPVTVLGNVELPFLSQKA